MSEHDNALGRVLEAAGRRAQEILNQASVYERKGMQPLADETLNQHYRPLRNAIETLRGDAVILSRDTATQAAMYAEAAGVETDGPGPQAVARALRRGDVATRASDTSPERPAPDADALAVARAAAPGGHLPDRYRDDAFVTETNSALWALNREREWITARCTEHGHPAAIESDGRARCWCGDRHGRLWPTPRKAIDVEITILPVLLEQLRAGKREAVRQLVREMEQHGEGCMLLLRPLETVR